MTPGLSTEVPQHLQFQVHSLRGPQSCLPAPALTSTLLPKSWSRWASSTLGTVELPQSWGLPWLCNRPAPLAPQPSTHPVSLTHPACLCLKAFLASGASKTRARFHRTSLGSCLRCPRRPEFGCRSGGPGRAPPASHWHSNSCVGSRGHLSALFV